MKRRLILITMLLAPLAAGAQQPPAQPPDLAARLEAAVNRRSLGTWWGAVVVAKDGRPILAKGFGFASEKLDPITADSLFDIASISKQFTAAAVLRLQTAGKLKTSDTVATFFPDLPERAGKTTLAHLLHHTSGLNDSRAIQRLDFPDRDEAVRIAFSSQFDSEPGERFAYSNTGYIILAAVIEKVTGRRFEDVVREEVLRPAGMAHSTLLDGKELDEAHATTRAIGGRGARPRRLPITADGWGWGLRGTSGILTSANDLIRWERALAGDALLGPDAKAEMFKAGPGGYACGWFVETTDDGRRRVFHSGSTRGYTAELSLFPDDHILVAVLTNETGDAIAMEQALLAELFPSAKGALEATIFVGGLTFNQYRLAQVEAARVSAARDGERLTITVADRAGHAVAELRVPAGRAGALAKQLAELAKASPPSDSDTPTLAMLGTMKYGQAKDVALKESLELRLLPAYRSQDEKGRAINDQRPTLIVIDEDFWPIILRLNPADAAALGRQLEPTAKP